MSELCAAACEIARGAGAILREAFGKRTTVTHKGAIDLVTDADRASEAFILAQIKRRFPDHDVLAEEGGGHDLGASYRWVVDPLDGTTNFAHALPHFAVLIAVQERAPQGALHPVAAATYDPLRDEMFAASRDGGATLNGRAIRVSATTRLIDATLTTGFAYDRLFRSDDNHAEFCRLNLLSQGVRRLGAAGLDLAYVACGRVDAFWEYHLHEWDLAGGILLVEEAGGTVTTLAGDDAVAGDRSLAASNGVLHTPLLAALHSARQAPINSRQDLAPHLPPEVAAELSKQVRESKK